MLLCIWQEAKQEISPHRATLPFATFTPQPDFQRLILPLRTDHIDRTDTAIEYTALCSSFGMPEGFERLPNTAKCNALAATGADRMQIIRMLNLSDHRNAIRAFSGSLRPVAFGMQSYKNFCDFSGRPRPGGFGLDPPLGRTSPPGEYLRPLLDSRRESDDIPALPHGLALPEHSVAGARPSQCCGSVL